MRGEIVSVGTEMLLGMIADTNAQYLAQQLAEIGVDVFWISQIGDNLGRVVEVFSRGLTRSDVIVVTGGLGPHGRRPDPRGDRRDPRREDGGPARAGAVAARPLRPPQPAHAGAQS
jgi:hypothetical protein